MEQRLFDLEALIADLRLSVRYASRLGLLSARQDVLRVLADAESALAANQEIKIAELLGAMGEVARVIAPITLSDLRDGRDPSTPENQVRSRRIQLILTAFTLVVLLVIGYFMHALQREQDVLKNLGEIQAQQPQKKLTMVRRLAQEENPIATSPTLFAEYRQRVQELLSLNSRLQVSYVEAVTVSQLPLFPFGNLLSSVQGGSVSTAATSVSAAPSSSPASSHSGPGSDGLHDRQKPEQVAALVQPGDTCMEDSDGAVHLPEVARKYPTWMKRILLDSLNDFCFQVKVLSPYGDSGLLDQSLAQLSFLPGIKEKVTLRIEWFLPFLYGVLGSSIFLMRSITSPRLPMLEWFPILVRVSLGGVAAIVMGWFSAPAASAGVPSTALSFPLALSFLTGYGIEVVFELLDRLNKAITSSGTKQG